MTEASTQLGDGLLSSKASASSAAYQHQMNAAAALGRARGVTQRHTPAVVYDNTRDWMASRHAGFIQIVLDFCRVVSPTVLMTSPCETGAGFGRRPFPRNSHRVAFPSLTQARKRATGFLPLVVRAYSRCAGSRRARDLSAIGSGSRPAVGNTLADQQSVNAFADLPHVTRRLSSPLFSSGIDPNEIGLTHAQASFAPGAKAND